MLSQYLSSIFLFRVKSFELIFESYPSLILGIFVIHGLQLYEFTNLLSCCISTISVVKGFGDYLAFVVNDYQAGAPLKLTALGMLASTLDSLFRAIFMAYACTIIKGGVISEGIFNLVPSSNKCTESHEK